METTKKKKGIAFKPLVSSSVFEKLCEAKLIDATYEFAKDEIKYGNIFETKKQSFYMGAKWMLDYFMSVAPFKYRQY